MDRSASFQLTSSTHNSDEPLTEDGFAEWLDEQFRDAHGSVREVLGMVQRRRKDQYWKKIHGDPYATGDKVWVWSKEKLKSKKAFDPWEGPYIVMARISEMTYKVAKQTTPSKVKFLHFNMLKRRVEDTRQQEEAAARERPSPYRSANFFEDTEMHIEIEAIWANNRERFNHDPGSWQEPMVILSQRNREALESLGNSPGLSGVLRRQGDAVETYEGREMEARREEEAANLPSEAEGRHPGETALAEPVMESETTDVGRPVRMRRPSVWFGIDEYVS